MFDHGAMSLTDDIHDVGVLAFLLLDGIDSEDFDDTMSIAQRSQVAFKKDNWSGVSSECKELIHFMVTDERRIRFNVE